MATLRSKAAQLRLLTATASYTTQCLPKLSPDGGISRASVCILVGFLPRWEDVRHPERRNSARRCWLSGVRAKEVKKEEAEVKKEAAAEDGEALGAVPDIDAAVVKEEDGDGEFVAPVVFKKRKAKR